MNRNDITVAVSPDGTMWIAQGAPAADKLPETADSEDSLFFSQVRHRCVAKTCFGWRVMTPSHAKRHGYLFTRFGAHDLRAGRCCGTPVNQGVASG